jgi:PmbA protein
MMTQDQLKDIFSDLSARAKKDGADIELSIGKGESFAASYQMRKLKKYSADQSQAAVIRVLYGKGTGLSTTENLSPEAMKEAYSDAFRSAQDLNKTAAPDKLEPALFEPKKIPDVSGIYHSDYSEVSTAQKLMWAENLEKLALEKDKRITNVPYSQFSHTSGERFLFNSKGLIASSKSSSLTAYTYALAKAAEDSKMGGWGEFHRNPAKFNDESIVKEAVNRTVAQLGATQPKTGKWNVIFANEVAAQFVGLITDHFSAKAMDEGTSLLKGKKGQQIFSKMLTWTDDPFVSDLSGARSFDAEGAPSQKTSLVKEGRIENYLTNSYYARKMNLPHTANASRGSGELEVSPSNIIVSKGSRSFEDLLKLSNDVIVITDVEAIHSGYKESTGDFSLPASGFLYRHGERQNALHQFVVSGNLIELLNRVTELSDRWNEGGDSTLSPDLFIPDVSLAGQS